MLIGCGGGGSNPPPPGPTPVPVHTPPPPGTQSVLSGAALQVLKVGQTLSTGFAGPNASNLHDLARRGAQGLRVSKRSVVSRNFRTTPPPPPLGPCTNKAEWASQQGQDATGNYTDIWLWTFYDAGCISPYSETYYRERVTGQNEQSETLDLSGTQQFLTTAGTTVTYSNSDVTLNLTVSGLIMPQSFSQQVQTADSPSSPFFSTTNAACQYNGGTPSACGFGSINSVVSTNNDIGAAINLGSYSQATTTDGGVNYTIAGTVNTFFGAYGGLQISAGTFPNWTISNGTAGPSIALSASYDFDPAGLANGGTVTATDTTDGIVVSVAIASNGGMAGTLKFTNGQAIASFNVDVLGNGTLTFANGNTGQIVAFGLI